MVSSIGCANPGTQATAPTKSIQWAPDSVANTMNYPDGCPSMQQIQTNLPQQLSVDQAQTQLTNIDMTAVQSTAPMNPYTLSTGYGCCRIGGGGRIGGGRIGGFGYSGGRFGRFGLFGGSWFYPYRSWPYAYSNFMYYPYGNMYYPYYYYNQNYYPAYYHYNPLSYGGCCGGASTLGYNPYYVYPFYYRTSGIYRPYFYSHPSLLWRHRYLRF